MLKLAFDIGGTFTDLVLFDSEDRVVKICKVPTTPNDPEAAVVAGIEQLLKEAGVTGEKIQSVFHATTIATNAILERKGCNTGLITTKGFRDVLLIGRQKRYDTHDLYLDKPEPLIRRHQIAEVDERVDALGRVVRPLNMESVDSAIKMLIDQQVESISVSLLHCYANPDHERKIAARVKELAPEIEVSMSSDVSGKYREYERSNTTVANAYIKPIVGRYLKKLEESLRSFDIKATMYMMQSNGGVVSPSLARQYPVRIIESGPAAGVLMCANVAREEGFDHVFTFDMGGTTAKFGAVDHGQPDITSTFEVDARNFRRFSGLPLNVSSIEMLEIGSGGGSIASTDTGLIKVGPKSAGAVPGPICYGRGGELPTITDANVVLGYLNPANFNAGNIELDVESAKLGIKKYVAAPLDIEMIEAAWGIHAVANSQMETAMRVISVEKGRDPQKYVLVGFGGAGPLHAARLARSLGIPRVIIPQAAGVGSALGLLTAQTRIDVSLTKIFQVEEDNVDQILAVYDELTKRAKAEVSHLPNADGVQWRRYAYMRYHGQGFEVICDLPSGPLTKESIPEIIEAFHCEYHKNYGYRDDGAVIEGVDWQLVAEMPSDGETTLNLTAGASSSDLKGDAIVGKRQAYFGELNAFVECNVIDRYSMVPGMTFPGPAIIEEKEASSLILPGDVAYLSDSGNMVIEIMGNKQ